MSDEKEQTQPTEIKEPSNSNDNKKIEEPQKLDDKEVSKNKTFSTLSNYRKTTPPSDNVPARSKAQYPGINEKADPNVDNNPGDEWNPNIDHSINN